MKKLSIALLLVSLLSAGCSNESSDNAISENDPSSWINYQGVKYEFYKTDVSVDDSLISTQEKTGADDGTESGLEIFKSGIDNEESLFIQDPMNQEWVEYRKNSD